MLFLVLFPHSHLFEIKTAFLLTMDIKDESEDGLDRYDLAKNMGTEKSYFGKNGREMTRLHCLHVVE